MPCSFLLTYCLQKEVYKRTYPDQKNPLLKVKISILFKELEWGLHAHAVVRRVKRVDDDQNTVPADFVTNESTCKSNLIPNLARIAVGIEVANETAGRNLCLSLRQYG
jgi:hypothetical protein